MKRRLTIAFALAALCATGALAALSFAPVAFAWGPGDLPPGFTVGHQIDIAPGSACPSAWRISGAGTFSDLFCESSPTFQTDFDAWVNAHYTAPTTTTAAATLPPVTTTVIITTTTPADPVTTTTATATSTAPDPQPAPTPITNTVTVTTTVTPVEQSLQAQIDALAAQISALTTRVDRLEKASDAAWLAYQQAIQAGDDPAIAAEIARGTAMNVIYGLGDFAP